MNIRIYTPEQLHQRQLAQHRRWYLANKDWVNPKRYATRKQRYDTDPVFRAKLQTAARDRKRALKQSTLLKAA